MDISFVPDLVQQFFDASQIMIPLVQDRVHQVSENLKNISAAFSKDSPYNIKRKIYSGAKIAACSVLFADSIVGLKAISISSLALSTLGGSVVSAAVVLTAGAAVADEVQKISYAGEIARHVSEAKQRKTCGQSKSRVNPKQKKLTTAQRKAACAKPAKRVIQKKPKLRSPSILTGRASPMPKAA